MFYREIIAVCSQIHTKHISIVCGQNVELLSVQLGSTYSEHCAVTRGNHLVESVDVLRAIGL